MAKKHDNLQQIDGIVTVIEDEDEKYTKTEHSWKTVNLEQFAKHPKLGKTVMGNRDKASEGEKSAGIDDKHEIESVSVDRKQMKALQFEEPLRRDADADTENNKVGDHTTDNKPVGDF